MNHRHVYMLIIEHAKSEMKNGLRPLTRSQKSKFENQYFEFHHILPKSLYPKWSKRKLNLVALTAREHFFCHQLLTKIYNTPEMHIALWYLCNDNQNNTKINSKTYETIRKNHQIAQKTIQKQRTNNEDYKLKCSERIKDYWQKLDSQKRTEIGLKSYNHRSEYDKKHILDKAMEWVHKMELENDILVDVDDLDEFDNMAAINVVKKRIRNALEKKKQVNI